jgi:pyruvate-formate lyase
MATARLTYNDRIELLRLTKLRQTREKLEHGGFMDHDDHGTVAPPRDFRWEPIPNHPDGSFYGAKGWAANFRALMEVHPVYVDPVDALAGRWMVYMAAGRRSGWPPEYDYPDLKPEQELYGILSGIGAAQHFGPDFRIGLKFGWGGLLAKVGHFRMKHGPEKAEFFQAEEDVILGVQTWIQRTIAAIREAERKEKRPELRDNLREMAEANEWIVENPPRTLREACQWIAWFNMVSRIYNGDGAGDQLDELLRPYYERDIAEGCMDDEKAIFYLACLLLNDPHYYQIGGPGPDGRDQTSHVSFLILDAAHRMGIPCNLTVRVHDGLNKDLYMTAVRHLLRDRKGWPRFSGDKGLMGFTRNGYSAMLARRRIAVGCHWMAIPGREYTLNDCVKINVAKVFEVAFWEMLGELNHRDTEAQRIHGERAEGYGDSGDAGARGHGDAGNRSLNPQPSTLNSLSPCHPVTLSSPVSVAELWQRFEEHLRRAVLCTAKGLDFHLAHQKDNQPELLINLLCDGPIEQGRDASDGGVEFYNMCVDGSGLATVADSFAALEQRIEREGVLTWEEVAQHLRNNFEGVAGERVRLMLRHSARYGQGESPGDEWAVRVSQLFTRLVKEKPTPGGRIMIPGWFTWSSTIPMGKIVGATPNGRRVGEPLSHGANPDPGFRKDGAPTAMAKAIAAIQPGYGNTAPMQLELDPGIARDEGAVENIASLIKTHFDLGGTLFNVNILDAEKLRAAHKDPAAYPDLIVRVTGFTAYFASLSPAFRQLVVDRLIEE